MPIYEYACTECGNRIEIRQSFTDPPLEVCEICGGKLRRVIQPVGIMFKGSGFYSTDARSDAAKRAKRAASSGKDAKKGDDSKPAAKKEGGSDSSKKSADKPSSSTNSTSSGNSAK